MVSKVFTVGYCARSLFSCAGSEKQISSRTVNAIVRYLFVLFDRTVSQPPDERATLTHFFSTSLFPNCYFKPFFTPLKLDVLEVFSPFFSPDVSYLFVSVFFSSCSRSPASSSMSAAPVLVLFQVVLLCTSFWRTAPPPCRQTSRTTEVLLLHKHQDRLNPSRQSVSKSVSQPLSQLAGQSEKSPRQFSVSLWSVLSR